MHVFEINFFTRQECSTMSFTICDRSAAKVMIVHLHMFTTYEDV